MDRQSHISQLLEQLKTIDPGDRAGLKKIYDQLRELGVDLTQSEQPFISSVNAALLTAISDFEASIPTQIQEQIDKHKLNPKLLEKLLKINRDRIRLEKARVELNKDRSLQQKVNDSTITKPGEGLNNAINDARNLLDNKEENTKFSISQKNQAIEELALLLVAGSFDPDPDLHIALATEVVFSRYTNTTYQQSSPIYSIFTDLQGAFQPATDHDYQQIIDNPDLPHHLDETGNFVISEKKVAAAFSGDLKKLSSSNLEENLLKQITTKDHPPEEILDPIIRNQANYQNLSQQLPTQALGIVTQNPQTQQKIENDLIKYARELNRDIRLSPSYEGSAVKAFNDSIPRSPLNSSVISIKAHGADEKDIDNAVKKLKQKRGSTLTLEEKRIVAKILRDKHQSVPGVAPKPLTGLPLNITKFASRLPFAKNLNPYQFTSWAGRRAGSSFARFVTRSGLDNVAMKQGLKILEKQGLRAAMKFLTKEAAIKLGAKAALQGVAQSLNLVAPGAGLVIAAAIEAGAWLLKQGGKIFNGMAKALWGERVRKIDVAGALGLAGGTVMAGFIALGVGAQAALAATFAAAGSAFMTIFFASAATLILYISALNVAPILSTIAQLDSGLGVGTEFIGPVGSERVNRPGIDCFIISDDKDPWPPEYLANMERVVNQIVNNYGGYTDKLCTGPLKIAYNHIQAVSGGKAYGGELLGDGYITIYPFGINQSFGSNLYTLAHETGHFFKPRNIGIWNLFLSQKISSEGYIHTYPLRKSTNEDFAEMIGIYIAGPQYPRVNVINQYPKHLQFAEQNIFN